MTAMESPCTQCFRCTFFFPVNDKKWRYTKFKEKYRNYFNKSSCSAVCLLLLFRNGRSRRAQSSHINTIHVPRDLPAISIFVLFFFLLFVTNTRILYWIIFNIHSRQHLSQFRRMKRCADDLVSWENRTMAFLFIHSNEWAGLLFFPAKSNRQIQLNACQLTNWRPSNRPSRILL